MCRIMLGLMAMAALSTPVSLAGHLAAPSSSALQAAKDLQATDLGTDRFGNLWWWDRNSGSLRVLSPEGERLPTAQIEGRYPTAVTFDAEWGAAALDMDRDLLLLASLTDPPLRVPRDGKATHLAWIGGGRLAVAPSRASHRVEIWDVETRRIVERWGNEKPISDGPGFHRLRAVLLAWDWEREVLWTLETFTGDLVVFSADGHEILHRTLDHPKFATTRAWVDEMEGKEANGSQDKEDSYLNLWSSLTLGPDASAWVLEGCDREGGKVDVIRIAADGQLESRAEDLAGCCPSGFSFWGREIVPFRDSRLSGDPSCKLTQEGGVG
jgi:hypothetical protein